jgi:hypothetical protein
MVTEERRKYNQDYYQQTKEIQKSRSIKWNKDHPEEKHQQNMSRLNEKIQWVKDNPEKRLAITRKYNKNNRDKVNEGNRRHRKERKNTLYKILGGYVCSCNGNNCYHNGKCNIIDERALQIGHKNDDGGKERKTGINRDKMYRFYILQPELAKEKLEVTCSNCNTVKEYERKQALIS